MNLTWVFSTPESLQLQHSPLLSFPEWREFKQRCGKGGNIYENVLRSWRNDRKDSEALDIKTKMQNNERKSVGRNRQTLMGNRSRPDGKNRLRYEREIKKRM